MRHFSPPLRASVLACALTGALTGALALGGARGAAAATLDFTDFASYDFTPTLASGSFMGVGWTMTSSGGTLTRNDGYDGAGLSQAEMQAAYGLVLDGDGIGVGDDEVSLREMVTVTFERSVLLVGVYLLDLFAGEEADIWIDGVFASGIQPDLLLADTTGGYRGVGPDEPIWLTSIGFTPWTGSARTGPDFAVAGIEIAAVPLPAGGLLLLTALGGLGLAARRRRA